MCLRSTGSLTNIYPSIRLIKLSWGKLNRTTIKKIRVLRTSNPRLWHKALKKVMCGDDQKDVIEVESIKDLPDAEKVELIAEFAEVAKPIYMSHWTGQEYQFLSLEKRMYLSLALLKSRWYWNEWMSTRLAEEQMSLLKFSRHLRISCVGLSQQLSIIALFRRSSPAKSNWWPPKYFWSNDAMVNKIMVKVTFKMIVRDMKDNMDPAQFWNKKGVLIQHYLVKMLDNIISALDNNSKVEAVAVLVTMTDWHQAFPRQCPTLAIQSFIRNGVRPALIPILMSFFEKMEDVCQVERCNVCDQEIERCQGSTKGVLSYMSQSNNRLKIFITNSL